MYLTQNPRFEVDDQFADLIFFALDHAVFSITDGGPLVPFLLYEHGAARGRRTLARYDADFYEESVSRARLAAASLPNSVAACVFAYDGFITVEGIKYSAIQIEGAERGTRRGVVFAQRYLPVTESQPFRKIWNPAFLGECDSPFNPLG